VSKTISLRIDDSLYDSLRSHAEAENRSISNYIETATLRYIEETDYVDDFEMENIGRNEELVKRLRRGSLDAKKSRGRFA
jgi:predicted DNA-binding protein